MNIIDKTAEPTIGTRLYIHVMHGQDKVVVDFGTKVQYLEIGPNEAESIAQMLLKHARLSRLPIVGGS